MLLRDSVLQFTLDSSLDTFHLKITRKLIHLLLAHPHFTHIFSHCRDPKHHGWQKGMEFQQNAQN